MTSIFIQSLADYNAGRIVGKWVDLENLDKDGLWDAISNEQVKFDNKRS